MYSNLFKKSMIKLVKKTFVLNKNCKFYQDVSRILNLRRVDIPGPEDRRSGRMPLPSECSVRFHRASVAVEHLDVKCCLSLDQCDPHALGMLE